MASCRRLFSSRLPLALLLRFLALWAILVDPSTHPYIICALAPPVYCFEIPTTDRPTAGAILQAFKGVYLSVVTLGEQVLCHVSPLSEVQTKILSLLDFSADIFTQLAVGFPKPAGKLTEP